MIPEPGRSPLGKYVCTVNSQYGEEMIREIPNGTLVHINGMPFKVNGSAWFSGHRNNFCLANEHIDEKGESPVDEDETETPNDKQQLGSLVQQQDESIDYKELEMRKWALDAALALSVPGSTTAGDIMVDAQTILSFLRGG